MTVWSLGGIVTSSFFFISIFLHEFSFSDIPGTVLSAPPFEAISVLSKSLMTSISFYIPLGDSIKRDVASRLQAGLCPVLFSVTSFSFLSSLLHSFSFALQRSSSVT